MILVAPPVGFVLLVAAAVKPTSKIHHKCLASVEKICTLKYSSDIYPHNLNLRQIQEEISVQ